MGEPRLVRVYADTRGHGRCRACGATLTWFQTVPRHQNIPFDGHPVTRVTALDPDGREVLALDAAEVHWATCPQASAFRTRRAASAADE
jgi:hypothetical protein